VFVPEGRWNVLTRATHSKDAYAYRDKSLKLDLTKKTVFLALRPEEVVEKDETYMIDSLDGGMVTEGTCICVLCMYSY
jgi:hypothetical protein